MNIISENNLIINNPETRPFLADAFYPESKEKLPLVIFVHGYKGYKDWGAWPIMARKFAEAGCYFVKFNFSHNGTTLSSPETFTDLKSFGENKYSFEISDLKTVITYFSQKSEVDPENITLIGHSRGGGISCIEAFENEKINRLITLASVETLDRFPKNDDLKKWKEEGIYYTLNGRTKQQMPHEIQFFEDFEKNKKRFDVELAMEQLKAKMLIIHGTQDEAVPSVAAEKLHHWNPRSELFLIPNANHTFGAKEPWENTELPNDLELATRKMIEFIKE